MDIWHAARWKDLSVMLTDIAILSNEWPESARIGQRMPGTDGIAY